MALQEGLAAAAAALASDAEPATDSGTNRPAGGEIRDAAAAGAAAGSETDVVVAEASVGEKTPGAGDEGSSCPGTDAKGGPFGLISSDRKHFFFSVLSFNFFVYVDVFRHNFCAHTSRGHTDTGGRAHSTPEFCFVSKKRGRKMCETRVARARERESVRWGFIV